MNNQITRSHNEYLVRSLQRLALFYSKRRSWIIRICYIVNIYLLFNAGSKSSKRKPGKEVKREARQKQHMSLKERILQSPIVNLLKHSRNNTKSVLYLAGQVSLLLAKAILTLKIATLDGQLVSSLVSKRFKSFFKLMAIWLLIGIPVSVTEALIEKTQSLLSLSIRSNVTNKLLDDYLPSNGNPTVYQLTNSMDSTIGDANHRLTKIVELFSTCCSVLPAQLLTPTLDILLAGNQLNKSSESSAEGAVLLGLIANISTLALRIFTPNFSKLTSMRNALENKFHTYHSNIVHNVEEIALAKGHRREIDILDTAYFECEKFQGMELRRLAVYNFAVSFIFKYSLGAFGLILCGVPTFVAAYLNNFQPNDELVSSLSSDFVTNRRLLLSASDSLGELIQSKKNIQNLVGYAKELWEFESELKKINSDLEIASSINKLELKETDDQNESRQEPLLTGNNVKYGDEITFSSVPLITPSGNVLVNDLTFSIKQGENLLIIGPNGCGKSSLFRILGGLWAINDPGFVTVPYSKRDLFYLPQRSYFTYGTLREQIIYPESFDDYYKKVTGEYRNKNGRLTNDEYLIELLQMVKLDHLVDDLFDSDSDDSDDTLCNDCIQMLPQLNRRDKWADVLSVGEQQRLAMVRLYYHCPKFAVLDECTSWISSDLEKECYRIATADMGITVISVCHRTTLWEFHSYILKFKREEDEEVSHTLFTKFDPVKRLERHEEMIKIDYALKKSDDIQRRLQSLKKSKDMSRSGSSNKGRIMLVAEDSDSETE